MNRRYGIMFTFLIFNLQSMSNTDTTTEMITTAVLMWRMHNFSVSTENFNVVDKTLCKKYSYDLVFGFDEKSNVLGVMHENAYIENFEPKNDIRCSSFNFRKRVWKNKSERDFFKKHYKRYADGEIINVCKIYVKNRLFKDPYFHVTKAVMSKDYKKAALMTLCDMAYIFVLKEPRSLQLNQLHDIVFCFK